MNEVSKLTIEPEDRQPYTYRLKVKALFVPGGWKGVFHAIKSALRGDGRGRIVEDIDVFIQTDVTENGTIYIHGVKATTSSMVEEAP